MNEFSFGQNQRLAQISRLGLRGSREWVATIFAADEIGLLGEFEQLAAVEVLGLQINPQCWAPIDSHSFCVQREPGLSRGQESLRI